MKLKICLLGLLGAAAALALDGCASVPEEGSLVYYDAGSIWCWRDGIGWNYLGERQVRIAYDHVPQPVHHRPGEPINVPPPGRHLPPTPGKPLPPGTPTCYFFFGKNGAVQTSHDGRTFQPIGHFDPSNQFVKAYDPAEFGIPFHGAFAAGGGGGSFHVASNPGAARFHAFVGSTSGTRGSASSFTGSYRPIGGGSGSPSRASGPSGSSRSSGSSGGYRSGGEGAGRSYSGGGGFQGGGGGGGWHGGGGGWSGGDSHSTGGNGGGGGGGRGDGNRQH